MGIIYNTFKKKQFIFEELLKRDFKKKYKRTLLGVGWSILSPLLFVLVLNFIFGNFFGRSIPHYAIYLLTGNLLFAYFREATGNGMDAIISNAGIFTKINIPQYLFVLSKSVASFINFTLTLVILLLFVFLDGLSFNLNYILLLYPVACLVVFNLGICLILATWFVFFRDIKYLYDVFCTVLMYGSAIFYQITIVPEGYRFIFYLNPVWVYINYFREIILYNKIPSLEYHFLALFYAVLALIIGSLIYKASHNKFLYYI